MSLSSTDRLAGVLAESQRDAEELSQVISPDESEAQEQIVITENITFTGTVTLNKYTYATTSFIIDHPVQGELDSTLYQLDGGYESETPVELTQVNL